MGKNQAFTHILQTEVRSQTSRLRLSSCERSTVARNRSGHRFSPAALVTFYEEIANCGFGPGAGIQGAFDGYGTCIDEPVSTIVPDYVWHRQVNMHRWDATIPSNSLTWRTMGINGNKAPVGSPCSSSRILSGRATVFALRFGMLPAGLPGLRDWPRPSHSSGHQR